jgi:hypothetical protein
MIRHTARGVKKFRRTLGKNSCVSLSSAKTELSGASEELAALPSDA